MSRQIGSRTFTMTDQEVFAGLSGDRNPMHLDAVRARRTIAGTPVVHGIHSLLWALDTFAAESQSSPIHAVKAEFPKFLAVGQTVELSAREDVGTTRLEIRADGLLVVKVVIRHTAIRGDGFAVDGGLQGPGEARDISFEEAAQSSGNVALPTGEGLWPSLAARIGSDGVAGLMATTYLVGMVTPGLHSTFSHVDLAFESLDVAQDRLAFRVIDARPGLPLNIAVCASSLTGTIRAYYRPPPIAQPSVHVLRQLVGPEEFENERALIVGGSRGLGELTAKLLAAGGAEVALTYAVGVADAEQVSSEIVAEGGRCSIISLDVTKPLAPQLASLPFQPTQVYYYPTPRIGRQKAAVFGPEIFVVFKRYYIDAFYELCASLIGPTKIFYPSSVFVSERPAGMTEYVMAKLAGEILAEDIARHVPDLKIYVERLPRMLTDQTAGVSVASMVSAPETIVKVVRAVTGAQYRGAGGSSTA